MIDENDIICEGVNLNLTDDISDAQEHNAEKFLMANNTITSTGESIYTAGDSIVLKVGFEAIGTFHAYIADCDLPSSESLENRSLDVKTALTLDIYPNPFSYTAQIRFQCTSVEDTD